MKLVLASLCFIFVYVSFLAEAQSSQNERAAIVRVRLMTTPEKVQISGVGFRFQNLNRPYQPVSIPQGSQAEIRVMEKQGKKIWAVRINNKDPEQLFADKYLFLQGENLRVGTRALPERVLFSVNAGGQVDVVAVMPLDDYVVGVLASEMPLSWPMETLKAQAVAARSYALAVMASRKDKAYHLESSILDQVFRHVLHENEDDPLIKKAVQAVRETQGQKLYASNNRVLKAFFHSDCGGKTTTAKEVWNHGVNTGVAVDNFCLTSPRAQWKLTMTKEELARRLGVPQITELELVRPTSERRVQAVRVAVNGDSEEVVSVNKFRQILGYQELRSSIFEIKRVGQSFLFEGQGYGHGVGLCQWGSRTLGQQGMTYKQILAHYYPLARLK